jgi:hypothetical protein
MKFLRLFLAVFRLTVLFRYDDMPTFKWLREEWSIWNPFWRGLFRCHRCLGVHAAWMVLLMDKFKLTRWVVNLLALAGAEMLVHDLIWKGKHAS